MASDRLAALLVEDNPDDADVLIETLNDARAAVDVTTVETLGDALTQLSDTGFDVVLLDLSLPDSQGLATVKRALAHTARVPILVLTGLEDEALGAAAVQAGAQDYLVKGQADGLMLIRCMRYAIERQRLLAAQMQLVDELERSNTVKTYFAATMSHELRGTLFAIGGLGDMLSDQIGATSAESAEAPRLARAITQRARESLGIIEAALELTRSEVRATDADTNEVAVDALMKRIADDADVPSEKTHLRVEWNVAPDLPPLRADSIKLEMVLKNLISNAIKFTDRGSVQVTVAPLEGAVQFIIADSGIGIDPEDLSYIFEPFTQAHGSRSRRAGGAGFGLYIVGRLVELLGGAVRVESQPDVGTTFTITLPAAPPQRG